MGLLREREPASESGVETGRGGEEGRKERIVRETRWPGVEREEKRGTEGRADEREPKQKQQKIEASQG
ncbi:L-serine/L-threonine ammonia-lyase [Sarotherodon galilaeus]